MGTATESGALTARVKESERNLQSRALLEAYRDQLLAELAMVERQIARAAGR